MREAFLKLWTARGWSGLPVISSTMRAILHLHKHEAAPLNSSIPRALLNIRARALPSFLLAPPLIRAL
jgi:hypothetical protein